MGTARKRKKITTAPRRTRRTTRGTRPTRVEATKRRSLETSAIAAMDAASDGIEHVVVLMLENRSFDNVLGALRFAIPGLDGLPECAPWRTNRTIGNVYEQKEGAANVVDPDPPHEHDEVLRQLRDGNKGFAQSYANSIADPDGKSAKVAQTMLAFGVDRLPSYHAIARRAVVCNRWFSSVPGPTWTNRLFAMSGTSLGRVKMPESLFDLNLHAYDQPSVFRRLIEAGKSYRIYCGDVPLALLLEDQRTLPSLRRMKDLDEFAADFASTDEFPEFAFIEPRYLGDEADDYHPPHDVMNGESLVAEVYDALAANPDRFARTLLVITFDEHGGFYDHVVPPETIAPDDHHDEFDFKRLGVRVPTLLVSPRLAPGVDDTLYDHTSLLRYLQAKWRLGDLGRRVAAANPIRVTPAPESLRAVHAAIPRLAIAPRGIRVARAPSDLQRSLVLLTTRLPAPAETVATGLRRAVTLPLEGAELLLQARARFVEARRTAKRSDP